MADKDTKPTTGSTVKPDPTAKADENNPNYNPNAPKPGEPTSRQSLDHPNIKSVPDDKKKYERNERDDRREADAYRKMEGHPEKEPKDRPKYTVKPRPEGLTAEARGAYDTMIGELLPGESGWLPLDDNGVPIGPAVKDLTPGMKACRVTANHPSSVGADLLVTNSGAPITEIMQANTDAVSMQEEEVTPVGARSRAAREHPENRPSTT